MRTAQKASGSQSSLVDVTLKMTGAATFTMISRVVVVRHLGGLLCAVCLMFSLFNLSSLHPWESRVLSNGDSKLSSYTIMQERRFYKT